MMSVVIPPGLISAASILAPLISSATAGSILTLSYFPLPIIRSLNSASSSSSPTEKNTASSLDHLKALFSSGSHIYPQLATLASGLYGLLAYALPAQRTGYSIASAGCLGIAPFTVLVMLPLANQRLLDLHEKREKQGGQAVENNQQEVEGLLRRFEWLNAVRAGIMAGGAVVGLYTALI